MIKRFNILTSRQLHQFKSKHQRYYYIRDLFKYYCISNNIDIYNIYNNVYLIIYVLLRKDFPQYDSKKNRCKFLNNHKTLKNFLHMVDTKIYSVGNKKRSNYTITFKQLCNLLYDFLKEELSKLEYDLNSYLLNICINKYKNIYGLSYNDISEKLLCFMSSNNPFSLINFNYTKPISIEKSSFSNKNVLLRFNRNVHGVLNNSKNYNSKSAPVIGISDIGINMNGPVYRFTKNYRIMRLSCNNYGNVFNKHNNVQEIKFFGQSFDSADYSYFFDIFDHYKIYNSDNNIKLVFYYVQYGGLSDDYCATKQINRINSLFYHYCTYRNIDITAKQLIHTLSFEGRLIILNLYDDISNNKDASELRNDINKIKSIQSTNNKNK